MAEGRTASESQPLAKKNLEELLATMIEAPTVDHSIIRPTWTPP